MDTGETSGQFHFDRFHAMGTIFEFLVASEHLEAVTNDFLLARELVRRYELGLSFHAEESELSLLNQTLLNSDGPTICSPLLGSALNLALTGKHATNGVFDPCYRSPGITYALTKTDHWVLQASEPGLMLDLGGLGKGIVADALRAIFDGNHVQGALLSLGGSTFVCIGSQPGRTGWSVRSENRTIDLSFNVTDAGLSFSSTKKRGDDQGLTRSISVAKLRHATAAVKAESAAWAEIASTALLVGSLSQQTKLPAAINSYIIEAKCVFHD